MAQLVAHLAGTGSSPRVESSFSLAHGKLCQSLGGLPTGMAQYGELAPEVKKQKT
jgi:hypothetical protein